MLHCGYAQRVHARIHTHTNTMNKLTGVEVGSRINSGCAVRTIPAAPYAGVTNFAIQLLVEICVREW